MDNKKIRQAAVLVLGLGEKYAAEILKNVSQQDARKLIHEIDKIESISDEEFVLALSDFMSDNEATQKIDFAMKENIKTKLLHSISSGQSNVLSKDSKNNDKWIEGIRRQPASMVVGIIRDEHPQVISSIIMVIFNNISSDVGIRIIKMLPSEIQKEILSRIARIGIISRIAVDFISSLFRQEIKEVDSSNLITVDGADTMASIMPYLDRDVESEVIGKLGEENQDLGSLIEDKIFPFHRLVELDKKSLQLLLAEISNEDLLMALKGADQNVRDGFFKNMSAKSADILKDDMAAKGPVKLATVTAAQKKIVKLAKQLEKEEKIFLSSSDGNIVF